jgi:hypothetical protein
MAGLDTDTVVIGAGAYGLSVSAHLSGQGTPHEIFGEPMDTWRNHMPRGMHLRSAGHATNISDPKGHHTLERFCAESDLEYGRRTVPVSAQIFARYGEWFAEHVVPRLQRRRVELVRSRPDGFELTLTGGQTLVARRVVVATGMQGYAYVPPELRQLPPEALVHSYDFCDPAQVPEAGILVIGAGQSALEAATLIHESDRSVRLMARRPKIAWAGKPPGDARPLAHRLRYPESGLGSGLRLRFFSDYALAFHAAPARWRLRQGFSALGPAGAYWLKPRFQGCVDAVLGRHIVDARAEDGLVRVRVRGEAGLEELVAGKVLAGTGYRPDVDRLTFIAPELRDRIATIGGSPVLDRSFGSSVGGLHFVGFPATASFGPVMRFVYGAGFAARCVARRLAC